MTRGRRTKQKRARMRMTVREDERLAPSTGGG
jgi:hypothetical protein